MIISDDDQTEFVIIDNSYLKVNSFVIRSPFFPKLGLKIRCHRAVT